MTYKKNVTIKKMKCDCKVVYARIPNVLRKPLYECSQSYVIGGNLK